jgi:hypothetical protein
MSADEDDPPLRPLRLEQCFGSAEDARGVPFIIDYLAHNPRVPKMPTTRRRVRSGLRFVLDHGERRLLDRRVSPRDRGTVKLVIG